MAEFKEFTKKVVNTQNETSQTICKYNKESFSTSSQKGQNAFIQSRVFKQAINIMGETISDMDIELERKDNKIQFLEDKIGIPDYKVIEEMNRIDLTKNIKQRKKMTGLRIEKTKHFLIIKTLNLKNNKTKVFG